MGYIADCLNTFNNLPKEVLDRIGSFETVKKVQAIENEYKVDLKFLVILITIDELTLEDISEYLIKQQNIAPEVAEKVKQELIDKIFVVFFDSKIQRQVLTINGLKEIFASNILGLLEADLEIKDKFNREVGYLLFSGDPRIDYTQDDTPQEEMDPFAVEPIQIEFISLMENNHEKFGTEKLYIGGKEVDNTISNWLKAYRNYLESGFGESIALSKFLTVGENGKKLNSSDREKLRSILSLYRNIEFFPDSMLDLSIDNWDFVSTREGEDFESETTSYDEIQAARPRIRIDYNFSEVFDPWLQSNHFKERLELIKERHALSEQQKNILKNILESLFRDKFGLTELFVEIRQGLTINQEGSGLLLLDILGHLIKPVGQYVRNYSDTLLEDLGGRVTDYQDPANIMTILNQIAIVKETKRRQSHEKEQQAEEIVEAKKEVAEKAKAEPMLARQLEEKLKDFYKHVKTPAIKQAEKEFAEIYDDTEEFTKQFYQAINDRSKDRVIGVLWFLASQGKLLDLLVEDKKIQRLYDRHLTKKYGDKVAQHFMLEPGHMAYLSYFLQHLLIDTLKMSVNDSAALTIHLLNEEQKATGKEVEMMSYGDMESQEFKWRKINSKSGRLIMDKE